MPRVRRRSFRANDRLVIERGETLLDEVHVVVTRTRGTQLACSSNWPIRDRHGRIIGLIGTNRPHESADGVAAGDEAARMLPAVTRMIRGYPQPRPITHVHLAALTERVRRRVIRWFSRKRLLDAAGASPRGRG